MLGAYHARERSSPHPRPSPRPRRSPKTGVMVIGTDVYVVAFDLDEQRRLQPIADALAKAVVA